MRAVTSYFGIIFGVGFLLAVILAGREFAEYIGSRDPVSGSVYVGMLLVFAAMPWLRWKRAQALKISAR